MSQPVHLRIRLFGAFRQYADGETLAMAVPSGTTVHALRTLLRQHLQATHPTFQEGRLVELSAFANDTALLGDDDIVTDQSTLAVLPPVSGG
jgi:molybdopterin converting factor small subunit